MPELLGWFILLQYLTRPECKKKVEFKNQGLIQLNFIQEENLEYIYDALTVVKAAPPKLSLANSHGNLLKCMQTCLI